MTNAERGQRGDSESQSWNLPCKQDGPLDTVGKPGEASAQTQTTSPRHGGCRPDNPWSQSQMREGSGALSDSKESVRMGVCVCVCVSWGSSTPAQLPRGPAWGHTFVAVSHRVEVDVVRMAPKEEEAEP